MTDIAADNLLDKWMADEQRIRAVLDAGVGCGVATPDMVAGKSGIELMQAMLRGELPYPHCLWASSRTTSCL